MSFSYHIKRPKNHIQHAYSDEAQGRYLPSSNTNHEYQAYSSEAQAWHLPLSNSITIKDNMLTIVRPRVGPYHQVTLNHIMLTLVRPRFGTCH